MLKVHTLKKRQDFVRITARCHKSMTPAFILQIAENPNPIDDQVRVGYTASRRVGGAIERNRAKRRLRALVAEIFPTQANNHFDYVLIAKTYCISRNFDKMRQELIGALNRHRESA